MIQILLSFVFIILMAVVVKCFVDDYNYRVAKGLNAKTSVKIIVWCLVAALALALSCGICKTKYEKGKTISTIPISEIYAINSDEFEYLIVDNEGDSFTLSALEISDVVKGDSSYLIHTHYPNSSWLSKFLINGPMDKCIIVLDDFNVPTIDKLSKQ